MRTRPVQVLFVFDASCVVRLESGIVQHRRRQQVSRVIEMSLLSELDTTILQLFHALLLKVSVDRAGVYYSIADLFKMRLVIEEVGR